MSFVQNSLFEVASLASLAAMELEDLANDLNVPPVSRHGMLEVAKEIDSWVSLGQKFDHVRLDILSRTFGDATRQLVAPTTVSGLEARTKLIVQKLRNTYRMPEEDLKELRVFCLALSRVVSPG